MLDAELRRSDQTGVLAIAPLLSFPAILSERADLASTAITHNENKSASISHQPPANHAKPASQELIGLLLIYATRNHLVMILMLVNYAQASRRLTRTLRIRADPITGSVRFRG
jgi:hypothetical protein